MDSEEDDVFFDESDWSEEAPDGITITINEPATAAAPKPYKILNEKDIIHHQENDITKVSTVLSVSRGVACSLLCRNNWNLTAAFDQWFAAEKAPTQPEQGSPSEPLCNICFDKTSLIKMASAACGHLFCIHCWKTYIATAINDGAACLTLRCPEPRCGAAVNSDMVEKFASESEIEMYDQHLRRSYVESSRNRKWCPAPGCDLAIEFDVVESETYDVVCDCSHSFCFRCAAERHHPVGCEAVAEWLERESVAWILSYTKPCPKCHRPIEKNQGCNHMICRAPCVHQFCWSCLSPWENHGGNFFICNKYIHEDTKKKKKEKKDRSRHGHYYEKWESNDKSWKMAVEGLERVRRRWWDDGDMKFVVEAWEKIVEWWRVLKWSYVYGYYMAEGKRKAGLFEFLLGEAEAALERLHHCVEKEMIGDEGACVSGDGFRGFRVKLLTLTSATSQHFENLVMASLVQDSNSDSSDSEYEKSRTPSDSSDSEYEKSKRSKYSSSD